MPEFHDVFAGESSLAQETCSKPHMCHVSPPPLDTTAHLPNKKRWSALRLSTRDRASCCSFLLVSHPHTREKETPMHLTDPCTLLAHGKAKAFVITIPAACLCRRWHPAAGAPNPAPAEMRPDQAPAGEDKQMVHTQGPVLPEVQPHQAPARVGVQPASEEWEVPEFEI